MALTTVNLPEDKLKPSKLERALNMIQMTGSFADLVSKGKDFSEWMKRQKGPTGLKTPEQIRLGKPRAVKGLEGR